MGETPGVVVRSWAEGPFGRDVESALERLARSDDVQRIAVMPDVHLAADVAGLREEAPSAYKDIDDVMRAEHELVRIIRRLRHVLSFKGV